jgi:heme oxygenase
MRFLRNETRSEHQKIERDFDLDERVRSVDGYRALLEDLTPYYLALEEKLEFVDVWGAIALNPLARRKSPLLASDLLQLGGIAADGPVVLPDVSTVARALGCVYVLEGSTLGGQIIAKTIRERLGEDVPCAFFKGYGKRTASMWREFGESMDDFGASTNSHHEILGGARDTFASLGSWLSRRKSAAGETVR